MMQATEEMEEEVEQYRTALTFYIAFGQRK